MKIFSTTIFIMQPNTWKYFPFRKIVFSENIYFSENILREPNTALDTTGKEYWSADIGSNPLHVGLLAFTEFLKLQPPAVFQQGFDCFSAGYSLEGSDFLTLSPFSRTLLCNEI